MSRLPKYQQIQSVHMPWPYIYKLICSYTMYIYHTNIFYTLNESLGFRLFVVSFFAYTYEIWIVMETRAMCEPYTQNRSLTLGRRCSKRNISMCSMCNRLILYFYFTVFYSISLAFVVAIENLIIIQVFRNISFYSFYSFIVHID